MGGICPFLSGKDPNKQPGRQHPNNNQGGATDRALNPTKLKKGSDTQLNVESKRMSLSETSNNGSTKLQTQKAFTKNASTSIGISEFEKKLSSVFHQGNSLDSSTILIKNPKEDFKGEKNAEEEFYTLIDKVVFVRKSMDCIKVSSPHGQSELKCPYPSILSTFYVSEGLPLESIKQISMGKIIQVANSPVKVTMKLKCKNNKCGRVVKLVFAKSLISVKDYVCDKCNQQGNWQLLNIDSNVPLWGQGRKIENGEVLDTVPSPLRALGCILCLRYQDTKQLDCGCLICPNCAESYTDKNCHICQALE